MCNNITIVKSVYARPGRKCQTFLLKRLYTIFTIDGFQFLAAFKLRELRINALETQ